MLQILGYSILEKIFESYNTLVYRAIRQEDKLAVILKILKATSSFSEQWVWFRREYEMTQLLSRSGIVQVYALESHQPYWVMVMEDFGGDSLDRLPLKGRLDLTDFLTVAIKLNDALGEIHQHHIIHQNLNPPNLVLNRQTGQVKIIDFGSSTMFYEKNSEFCCPNFSVDTLPYISPEQTGRMNCSFDYRSDFYALGVTFYELLTGQLPFTSTDTLDLVHSHVAKWPTSPHQVKSDIPEIISQIILKLLAKNPQDRYQSSHGLKADLIRGLTAWQTEGQIEPFPVGVCDISRNSLVSPALYVSETEAAYISAAINAVPQRNDKLMSVSSQVSALNIKYPRSTSPIHHPGSYYSISPIDKFSGDLDLETLFKGTQLMADEVELEPLLTKFMPIILKSAGATRGMLLLQQAGQWFIEAEGVLDSVQLWAQTRPFNATLDLPFEIIDHVIQSQKSVLLDEAIVDSQFGQTTYIKFHHPKSILCVPLISARVMIGVIYLENNLANYAFTTERLQVVTLLGMQMVMSITNVKAISDQAELTRLQIEKNFYEEHAAELVQINQDKDKFFSVVAHDLKGPFMPLLEYAEYLKEVDESYSVEELRDLGQTIHSTAQTIYTLLENLLQWERLQLGRMKCQPTSILLGTVIQKTMQLLTPTAAKKQITLQDNLTPGLVVNADEYMTYTIIRNLTTNALKFTPNGGQVTISTQPIGTTEIEITVADTGVGISPQNIAKLFKLGTHFTTQGTAQEKGTGLGLIMCHEMVELNGGRIWIESELGHGTAVKFTLPRYGN